MAAALDSVRPDVVVNAAAYTAVDAAEEHEDLALRVNGEGPRVLAAALAQRPGIRLVHISTDYVFAGDATTPYPEDAQPAPRSAYGRTKLAGEVAVREVLPDRAFLVRTAWLYGVHGPNFVRTMLALEETRPEISVVDDQRGQPTWSRDLARQIVALLESDAPQASTTGRHPGRRRGSSSPARSTGSSGPTPRGSSRRRRTPSHGRHPGRPTASWATIAGPWSVSPRSGTGAMRWPRPFRSCARQRDL